MLSFYEIQDKNSKISVTNPKNLDDCKQCDLGEIYKIGNDYLASINYVTVDRSYCIQPKYQLINNELKVTGYLKLDCYGGNHSFLSIDEFLAEIKKTGGGEICARYTSKENIIEYKEFYGDERNNFKVENIKENESTLNSQPDILSLSDSFRLLS